MTEQNTVANQSAPLPLNPESLIDLARYPITDPKCALYQEAIAQGRQDLAEYGSAKLEGFLSATGLELLQAEVAECLPDARLRENQESPYGVPPTGDFPEGHPYRHTESQRRHHVARHQIPKANMDALYNWAPMRSFTADLMGKSELFVHEDPSNAFVLMVYKQTDHLAWHFDMTEYSLVISLQATELGGIFEYVPDLRKPDDECLDDVKKVLEGDRSRVVQVSAKAGTFTVFKGKYAMHKVTTVESKTPRVQMIFCYENEPGLKLDVKTRKLFYGDDAPDDGVYV